MTVDVALLMITVLAAAISLVIRNPSPLLWVALLMSLWLAFSWSGRAIESPSLIRVVIAAVAVVLPFAIAFTLWRHRNVK